MDLLPGSSFCLHLEILKWLARQFLVLQESLQNSPVPSGTGRSRDTPGSSHPPDFSAEIKVEDIDLDSADEEDDEEEDGGAKAREMDDRVSEPPRETGLDSGEDGQGYSGPSHVPSLTLQSFARIPALTPLAAPLQLNDDNVPTSHDIIPGKSCETTSPLLVTTTLIADA